MESVNIRVEDVEQCKIDPGMSIDIEWENNVKIVGPHCDSHTPKNDPATTL